MIPYRRQKAIEAGTLVQLAADLASGDVIEIRKPGEVEMSHETILEVRVLPKKRIRLTFESFVHETYSEIPVRIISYTEGTWRQYIGGEYNWSLAS